MSAATDRARAFAFSQLGIQKSPTIENHAELTLDQKKRVLDEMALYIVDNPDQFAVIQLQQAQGIVSRPTFRQDLPESKVLTFSEAFGLEVKKKVKQGSDVAGKAISGGIQGILSGNLITLLALGVAGFVTWRIFANK